MILCSRLSVLQVDPPSRVGLAVKAKASKATNHDAVRGKLRMTSSPLERPSPLSCCEFLPLKVHRTASS